MEIIIMQIHLLYTIVLEKKPILKFLPWSFGWLHVITQTHMFHISVLKNKTTQQKQKKKRQLYEIT